MKNKSNLIRLALITAALMLVGAISFAQSHGCHASFSAHANASNNDVNFNGGFNSPGAAFAWDFGDGGTDHVATPTHTYASAGTYYVCLTVTRTDSAGIVLCTDQHCDSIHAGPPPVHCDAHFFVHHLMHSDTLRFDGNRNIPGTTYAWDYGDGTTGSGEVSNHLYAAPGVYYACLTVNATDSLGNVLCNATWCDSIRVGVPPPPPVPHCEAHFRWGRPVNNDTLIFGGGHNAIGTVYAWDFGDGSTGNGQFTNHLYAQPGTYYVCLTVTTTDSTGAVICTDTHCDSVNTTGHFGCRPHHHPHHFHFSNLETNNTSSTMEQSIERLLGGSTTSDADVASITATVYPNPLDANSVIRIQNASGRIILRIYESDGRLVDEKEYYNADEYRIADKNLGRGIYFYQVVDETNSAKGRFIVR